MRKPEFQQFIDKAHTMKKRIYAIASIAEILENVVELSEENGPVPLRKIIESVLSATILDNDDFIEESEIEFYDNLKEFIDDITGENDEDLDDFEGDGFEGDGFEDDGFEDDDLDDEADDLDEEEDEDDEADDLDEDEDDELDLSTWSLKDLLELVESKGIESKKYKGLTKPEIIDLIGTIKS